MSRYSTLIQADTPSSYWRMDAPSGTVETDLQALHNGNYSGVPTLAQAGALPHDPDTAVLFAAASQQRLEIVDDNAYSFSAGFTVECWSQWAAAPAGTQHIISKGNTAQFEWAIQLLATGVVQAIVWNAAGTALATVTFGAAPSTGAWHHLVFTILDAAGTATVTTFLDGAQKNTGTFATASYTNGTSVTRIAGRADATGYFSGLVDEVAIYQSALSALKVANHYSAGLAAQTNLPLCGAG